MITLRTYQPILSLLLVMILSVTIVTQSGLCSSMVDTLFQSSAQDGCCPSQLTSSDADHSKTDDFDGSRSESNTTSHHSCECCSCGFMADTSSNTVFVSVSKQTTDQSLSLLKKIEQTQEIDSFSSGPIYRRFRNALPSQRPVYLMHQVFLN